MLLVLLGVLEQGIQGLLSEWTDSFLVAFAEHPDLANIPIDILPIEATSSLARSAAEYKTSSTLVLLISFATGLG